MKHIIKNHKRGLSVLMMLFLLFVISGCGEQKTDMAVGDTITIEYSWWGDDSRNQYTLDAVDILKRKSRNKRQMQIWCVEWIREKTAYIYEITGDSGCYAHKLWLA